MTDGDQPEEVDRRARQQERVAVRAERDETQLVAVGVSTDPDRSGAAITRDLSDRHELREPRVAGLQPAGQRLLGGEDDPELPAAGVGRQEVAAVAFDSPPLRLHPRPGTVERLGNREALGQGRRQPLSEVRHRGHPFEL
ncbi:hypothetical protein [Aeromicrobium sp. UC242_57]|uniref:hypothetical protein n=1 Tax=Aeromicrobium sp. UC242_57 TaxID=3374624 RepID=UPI00378F5A0D